jgi:hypothetical protein
VPHPNAPGVFMPGPPIEQFDITFTTKERDLVAGVKECCSKVMVYAGQVAAGAAESEARSSKH